MPRDDCVHQVTNLNNMFSQCVDKDTLQGSTSIDLLECSVIVGQNDVMGLKINDAYDNGLATINELLNLFPNYPELARDDFASYLIDELVGTNAVLARGNLTSGSVANCQQISNTINDAVDAFYDNNGIFSGCELGVFTCYTNGGIDNSLLGGEGISTHVNNMQNMLIYCYGSVSGDSISIERPSSLSNS